MRDVIITIQIVTILLLGIGAVQRQVEIEDLQKRVSVLERHSTGEHDACPHSL